MPRIFWEPAVKAAAATDIPKEDTPYVVYCKQCEDLCVGTDFITMHPWGVLIGMGSFAILKQILATHPKDHRLKYKKNANGRMGL